MPFPAPTLSWQLLTNWRKASPVLLNSSRQTSEMLRLPASHQHFSYVCRSVCHAELASIKSSYLSSHRNCLCEAVLLILCLLAMH
jgi:hypothetical protein